MLSTNTIHATDKDMHLLSNLPATDGDICQSMFISDYASLWTLVFSSLASFPSEKLLPSLLAVEITTILLEAAPALSCRKTH